MSKTTPTTKIPDGPAFTILRWVPEDTVGKWVVMAYCMREDEILKRYEAIQKVYPGSKLQTFISLKASRREDAKEATRNLIQRMAAKYAS